MKKNQVFEFRWPKLVQELRNHGAMSYFDMQRQSGIDRRRFSALAGATHSDRWGLKLSIDQLCEIRKLLVAHGKRPDPMFSSTLILEAILQRSHVTVVVGSTARDDVRSDVGYWDVLSLKELLFLCSKHGR